MWCSPSCGALGRAPVLHGGMSRDAFEVRELIRHCDRDRGLPARGHREPDSRTDIIPSFCLVRQDEAYASGRFLESLER